MLSGNIFNYTKDHGFLWLELIIPITYGSDWKSAIKKILSVVEKETSEVAGKARKDIAKLKNKYYFNQTNVSPSVSISLTSSGVNLIVRYVNDVRVRVKIRNEINKKILERIEKSKNIHIAIDSLDVTLKNK